MSSWPQTRSALAGSPAFVNGITSAERAPTTTGRARPGPCLPGIPGKGELHCSGGGDGGGGGATPELLNNMPSIPSSLCLHPPIREHVCNCDLTSTFHLVSIEINRHFSHARWLSLTRHHLALTHTRRNIIKSGCRAASQQSLIIMLLLSYDHINLISFQCIWDKYRDRQKGVAVC